MQFNYNDGRIDKLLSKINSTLDLYYDRPIEIKVAKNE